MYDCFFTPEDFDKQFLVLMTARSVRRLVVAPRMTNKYKVWAKDFQQEADEKGVKPSSGRLQEGTGDD